MITKAYVDFFRKLEENNHKDWFHTHKKQYELHVKSPFHQLVNELIEVLKPLDPQIPEDPKAIIMRINKDIRFSKDKRPYHLLMKANFTPGGRKSQNPGFYLGIGADRIHVGGGLYQSSTQDLKAIRRYVVAHEEEIIDILNDSSFKNEFGDIGGEKVKRLDTEWSEAAVRLPLLYHKQFFYMKELPIEEYFGKDLALTLTPLFHACTPLHRFLKKAVNSE